MADVYDIFNKKPVDKTAKKKHHCGNPDCDAAHDLDPELFASGMEKWKADKSMSGEELKQVLMGLMSMSIPDDLKQEDALKDRKFLAGVASGALTMLDAMNLGESKEPVPFKGPAKNPGYGMDLFYSMIGVIGRASSVRITPEIKKAVEAVASALDDLLGSMGKGGPKSPSDKVH